jgi:hypothetical protein
MSTVYRRERGDLKPLDHEATHLQPLVDSLQVETDFLLVSFIEISEQIRVLQQVDPREQMIPLVLQLDCLFPKIFDAIIDGVEELNQIISTNEIEICD